jgi:uncharacterized repeat protein (TIGR01451 family)
VPVGGLDGAVAIAAGGARSFAVRNDGTVWEWRLCCGGTAETSAPRQFEGLTDIISLSADCDRALALKNDGSVWTWGLDQTGAPEPVEGLAGAVAVATVAGGGLALDAGGAVWEWKFSKEGAVVDLARVPDLDGVIAIAGGNAIGFWMCGDCGQRLALKNDGTIWAWGFNGDGQMGDGSADPDESRAQPVQVAGLAGVTAIATGDAHSLAVTRDGMVWAWGSNNTGQLAESASGLPRSPGPVPPPGSPDLAISTGHTGHFAVGRQGVYTVTLANAGASTAEGTVTVTDILPPGLALVSATGSGFSCSAAGQTVTCKHPGPVEPGASLTIVITVDVGPEAAPGVTNMATVSNESDRNACNNAAADPTTVLPGR